MSLQLSTRRFEQAFFNFIQDRLDNWLDSEFFDIYPQSFIDKISFSDTYPKKAKELNGKTILTLEVTSEINQTRVDKTESLRPLLSLNIFSQTRAKNIEVQEFLIDLLSTSDLTKIQMIDNVKVTIGFLERRVQPSFDSGSEVFNSFIDFRFFLRRVTKVDALTFLEMTSNTLHTVLPTNYATTQNNSNFLVSTVGTLESHARAFIPVDFKTNIFPPFSLIKETNHRELQSVFLVSSVNNLSYIEVDVVLLEPLQLFNSLDNLDYS